MTEPEAQPEAAPAPAAAPRRGTRVLLAILVLLGAVALVALVRPTRRLPPPPATVPPAK